MKHRSLRWESARLMPRQVHQLGAYYTEVLMLCLGRKVSQEIRIGKDTIIRVLEIKGGIVRLGITAPKEIEIVRTELDKRRAG